MKVLGVIGGYWIIGCLLLGVGRGSLLLDCPNDRFSNESALTFVTTWPTIFGFVAATAFHKLPERTCQNPVGEVRP